jgi:ubiquinone/menaquinone biosynthesis C-methylase UbiE
MAQKDYFSNHSKLYAAFRPTYPDELYNFIFRHLNVRDTAWDCGTGNGQVAQYLANHFSTVYATDISAQQLAHAFKAPNIIYSVSPAEHTSFNANQFDLITVGQALHWFQFDAFFSEVRRTGKQGGLLAVWGYGILAVSPEIDPLFLKFYHETVGTYWDYARKLVENGYESVPFPFESIKCPEFKLIVNWDLEQFGGYLESWSATQKFIQQRQYNPVPGFLDSIKMHWATGETREVTFPLFLKLGKIK